MSKTNTLYLQIIGGISGDMFLALMADLGVELKELESIISEVIPVKIAYQKRRTKGFSGTRVDIHYNENQCFRNLFDLEKIVNRLNISSHIKQKSIKAFRKLAQVEAEVHGISTYDVHFHEVGAVDTLVDVVGCFFCLEKLGVLKVYSSKIPLFEGYILCEHGKIFLPAPATLKLLKDKPTFFTSENKELITPTGALILDQVVDSYNKKPEGKLILDGIGIGHMELNIPNILRGILFEEIEDEKKGFLEDEVYVLETNIDHMTGEEIGYIFDTILESGALDVFFIPGVMKKNRPAGILKVICSEDRLDDVLYFIFKNTMSLGVRLNKTKRVKLDRFTTSVNTNLGDIALKEFKFQDRSYKRPEFESLKTLCKKNGMSPVELRLKLMENGLNIGKKDID